LKNEFPTTRYQLSPNPSLEREGKTIEDSRGESINRNKKPC